MSKDNPVNMAASVRDKLYNLSLENKRNFQEVVQYYAMERFLYRLGQSRFRESFILKGGLMLPVWGIPQARSTMDIDFLARINNESIHVKNCVKEVLNVSVPDDGLSFDSESATIINIAHDAAYEGKRVQFMGYLEKMKIRMKIDIGFSDIVLPSPCTINFPTALGMESPILQGYTRESAIAEKFHAMVFLGIQNSRMKDFYDIDILSRYHSFDGRLLSQAVAATFTRRHTDIPDFLIITTPNFLKMKEIQWSAFLGQLPLSANSKSLVNLAAVVHGIEQFLLPLCRNILAGEEFNFYWDPSLQHWG